ncbi:MAG: GtrA family protein [Candidatus Daviesbacteria bacterium]|nr:GtrA family protein [Candidatus Daviesbacteria bacterium]
MKTTKKVVVVTPTFNEKGSIEKVIDLILEQNGKIPGFDIHVLVSDSHSPDGTGEIVKKIAAKNMKVHFLDVYERGLGLAIIKGYEYALDKLNADVLMQIDADLQHNPNEIPLFLEKIAVGFEYVQGSRYIKGGENRISITRQIFSFGASLICRVMTGIWQISDFTPSYKAYDKNLYLRMNLSAIPWEGTTFLIQPAAIVEADRAGAKMAEVPIKFNNRRVDRSKNEVVNYIIDILGYCLEIRLSKWGIKFPVLYWVRRSKTFIKFGMVGFAGTIVDFIFYNIFIGYFGFPPASAKGLSTEIAIFNNFTFNNIWTFKRRKTKNKLWKKFGIFNLVSFGGLAISVVIIKLLHSTYGDGIFLLGPLQIQFYNLYFFATIPLMMTWNFLMNHFVTWRHEED